MRVVVGLSGGVDSSLAVAELLDQGHEVVGATLVMQRGEVPVPAADAAARAEALCRRLGVPFYRVPVDEAFSRWVTNPFADGYLSGRTPNPCVACNRHVKVAALVDLADEIGAEAVATGHYVGFERGADGVRRVVRGADRAKDQSYFLAELAPATIERLMAPLSHTTKDEVRRRARERSMDAADAPDSQGVCFAPSGDYRAFLRERRPNAFEPGDIVDGSGSVLGRHPGTASFTVGQRKGLDIKTGGGPWYVTAIDPATATVTVSQGRPAAARRFTVVSPHLTLAPELLAEGPLLVQVRHGAPAVPCTVEPRSDGSLAVALDGSAVTAAPGQTAAFYRGDVVLGGGTIA